MCGPRFYQSSPEPAVFPTQPGCLTCLVSSQRHPEVKGLLSCQPTTVNGVVIKATQSIWYERPHGLTRYRQGAGASGKSGCQRGDVDINFNVRLPQVQFALKGFEDLRGEVNP